jgi:hypothetical protein
MALRCRRDLCTDFVYGKPERIKLTRPHKATIVRETVTPLNVATSEGSSMFGLSLNEMLLIAGMTLLGVASAMGILYLGVRATRR